LTDANNYTIETSLNVPITQVEARSDVLVDFSSVGVDLLGDPLDPALDIVTVSIVNLFGMEPEAAMEALAADQVLQSDVGTYMTWSSDGATEVLLSELSFLGNPFLPEEELEPDSGSWLLVFSEGVVPGQGARQLAFVEPVEGAEGNEVDLGTEGAGIGLEVDIERAEGVVLPASEIELDLSELELDGQGGEFDPLAVDQVWLAWFEDASLAELESDFVHLEERADRLYSQAHDGASGFTLDALVDGDGVPFESLDSTGTWLLALLCTTCLNPAPKLLTPVERCEEVGEE
jgi:hypothetical protein